MARWPIFRVARFSRTNSRYPRRLLRALKIGQIADGSIAFKLRRPSGVRSARKSHTRSKRDPHSAGYGV